MILRLLPIFILKSKERFYDFSKKIAGMASMQSREALLKRTITSVYDQFDEIAIYLNDYDHIPSFLKRDKIKVWLGALYGDLGDGGKFFQSHQAQGYYFGLDDDILYPSDYAAKMVEKINEYEFRALLCVQGNDLPQKKMSSYYADKTGHYFEAEQSQDHEVHIPGTGTVAFHTDFFKLHYGQFLLPNMTDLWLGSLALSQDIPIICVARPFRWLKQQHLSCHQNSIRQDNVHYDYFQTLVAEQKIQGRIYGNTI